MPSYRVIGCCAALLALAGGMHAQVPPAEQLPVRITVDSAQRSVVIAAGPLRVPAVAGKMDMATMMERMADHDAGTEELLTQFRWPMTSWLRGYHLQILDKDGRQLPRRLLHHLEMVNLDRRQLVYATAERVLGIGQETAEIFLPSSVGLPMVQGHDIAIYVMWDNETGHDIDGVTVRFTLLWMPDNLTPRPVPVLPFRVDVNEKAGGSNSYDVPPGGNSKAYEFTVPISGHLLAVGGHMHDHGVEVRLEDVESGRVLARVRAVRDSAQRVTGISRSLFGIIGQGPHLIAHHRYRLVAVYDNPTDTPVMAMALMAGLFAPDDFKQWPAVDRTNRDYLLDITPSS